MNFERTNKMGKVMTVKVYIENYNQKRINICTLNSEDGKNQTVTITSELAPNFFKQAFKTKLTETVPLGRVTTQVNANEINNSHNTDSGNVEQVFYDESQSDNMESRVLSNSSGDANQSISPDSGRPASEGSRSPVDLAKNVDYNVEDFLNEVDKNSAFQNAADDTQRVTMRDNPMDGEADGDSNGEDSDCETNLEEYFIVDKLVGSRFNQKTQKYEFLLKTKQCAPKNESWNPIADSENCDISLLEYGRLYVEAPESLKPMREKEKKQNVLRDKFLSEGNIPEVTCDTDDGGVTLNQVKIDASQLTDDQCQGGTDNENNNYVNNSCPINISEDSLELEMPRIESNFQEMVLMEPVDLVHSECEVTKTKEGHSVNGAVKVPRRKTTKKGPKSKSERGVRKERVRFIKMQDFNPDERIKCISCTFSSTSKEAMKRHVKRHLTIEKPCPHCDRTFLSPHGLSRHISRHELIEETTSVKSEPSAASYDCFPLTRVKNELLTSTEKRSPPIPRLVLVNKVKRKTKTKRESEFGSCDSIYKKKYKNESSKRKRKRMLAHPDSVEEVLNESREQPAGVLTEENEKTEYADVENRTTSAKTEPDPVVQTVNWAADGENAIPWINEATNNVTQDSESIEISPFGNLCESVQRKDSVCYTTVQSQSTIADQENAGMTEDRSTDELSANSILCTEDGSCREPESNIRTVDETDGCTNDLRTSDGSEISEEILISSSSRRASPSDLLSKSMPEIEDAEVSDDSISTASVCSDSSDPDYEENMEFPDLMKRPKHKRRRLPISQNEKRFKPEYSKCFVRKTLSMDRVLVKSESREVLNCRPVGFEGQGPFNSNVDGEIKSLRNGGIFVCSTCDKCFTKRRGLIMHQILYHGCKRRVYTCVICEAKYLKEDTLTNHLLRSHGLKEPVVVPVILLKRIDDVDNMIFT